MSEHRPSINPARGYWIVGDNQSSVWSSEAGAYLPLNDAGVVAFLDEFGRLLKTPDEETLFTYLRKLGLPGVKATTDDVVAERVRRLALGFNYNFGDARGVHRIGTTESDMKGWDEVTTLANALIANGYVTQAISIVTDTGPCEVTPLEWQAVLLAAAQFRQPIWAASFAVQAMTPIPADYTDDQYWPPIV